MAKTVKVLLFTALFPLALGLSSFGNKKSIPSATLKFDSSRSLKKIPEPSDIVFDAATGNYYIVSDHGMLFECRHDGSVIRKAQAEGQDFEGVEVVDSFIYVSDETPRLVYKYRKSDLSLLKTYRVTWSGAANKAFESIFYNQTKKCFVLIAEAPATIIEYDENFKEQDRHTFYHTRDVSGARWYNGFVYIIGGKDATIFKCDPNTYEIREEYRINAYNPEGIAFDPDGHVLITSDDMQRLYFFNQLPIIKQTSK